MMRSPLTRVKSRRRTRGAAIVEFAMIVPFLVAFIMVCLDLGHLALTKAVLSEVTFSSAHAGAQAGVPGSPSTGIVHDAFVASVDSAPLDANRTQIDSVQVSGANGGGSPGQCSDAQPYVDVQSSTYVDLMTPGLAQVFGNLQNNGIFNGSDLLVRAKATARCDVIRG